MHRGIDGAGFSQSQNPDLCDDGCYYLTYEVAFMLDVILNDGRAPYFLTNTNMTHVRKPATLINVAYFTTLIIGALAFSTAYFYNESHAMGTLERLHCDYVFSNYAFTEVNRADYPRCEKRFDYLTKRFQSNSYSV